jgi:hypothetical protein
MKTLIWQPVQEYRQKTFRFQPMLRVKSEADAISYVKERGFIYFWPIRGITLPSLWGAVAGDRPVADAHDDPGHVTWGWKDQNLGGHHWYYGKVLRKKATMISLSLAPYFYALSENYGSPEDDYRTLYEQGLMTQEARLVYEVLLDQGVMDTPALRRATHLSSRASESRFNRAMADLQADFKIVPVSVTQAGAWHYAFAYDIVPRHYPDIPEKAQNITERQARRELAFHYLRSLGAAQIRDLQRLFAWRAATVDFALNQLLEENILERGFQIEGLAGEWVVLKDLL